MTETKEPARCEFLVFPKRGGNPEPCGKPIASKDMCRMHLGRYERYGDPTHTVRTETVTGLGKLRCRVCDQPYSEHPTIMGPCYDYALRMRLL